MDYTYDVEIYPNIFSVVFANKDQKKLWIFEISDRKDESNELRKFLTKLYKDKARMVGFNNIGFDYPVIHFFLTHKGCTYQDLYAYGMDIIESMRDDKFGKTIPEHKHFIKQLDLYKIHHFDNKAKATSLKLLEYNMRSRTIEDLPFPVGKTLSHAEKDMLLKYNQKDVLETLKFYEYSQDAIALRETLEVEYGIPCMNYNDTKIGKEFFVKELEAVIPNSCYTKTDSGRKVNQTKRDYINIGEILFDYYDFHNPAFQAIYDWFGTQTITETKGCFSDIPEHLLGDVAQYARLTTKRKKLKVTGEADKELAKELRKQMKADGLSEDEIESLRDQVCGLPTQNEINQLKKEHPLGWVTREVLKSGKTSYYFCWNVAESLNVVVDGMEYVFGTGGIHSSVNNRTFVSENGMKILDLDFASYYPNLFISNRIYPEHLSEVFCDIYKRLYEKRKTFPKGSPQNAVMKLALNGSYGSTNDKFSPFYDPKSTMAITINGQLTLANLIDKVIEIAGVEIIQSNSDGFTIYCPENDLDRVREITKYWDKITGLEMEEALYTRMAIRDVNSYVAVYENGKVKRNGAFEYKIAHIDGEGLGFHQNQSAVIIKRAAVEYITEGKDLIQTIKSCKVPFDFCYRTKVPRSSRLVTVDEEGIEFEEQNIARYFIATNGRAMVKIMPPLVEGGEERRLGINVGQKVKVVNNIDYFDFRELNYDHYIQEAISLVESVGGSYEITRKRGC